MERLAVELIVTANPASGSPAPPAGAGPRPKSPWKSSAGGLLLVAPLLLTMALLVVVPIGWEIWHSLMDPGFTTAHYREFIDGRAYTQSLLTTIRVAAIVTLVCLPLGYALAYVLANIGGRITALLIALTIIPFWTSAVVRSFAWILLLQRNGTVNDALQWTQITDAPMNILGTSTAVYIGMASVLLPVMVLPLFNAMREIDPGLLRAASSLGASSWKVFREVFLPLSLPGVAAGCLLVFIMSLGYFITPSMLGGAKDTMIAVLIYQQTEAYNWPAAFALSTVLLVAVLTLYAIASLTVGLGRLLIGAHRT